MSIIGRIRAALFERTTDADGAFKVVVGDHSNFQHESFKAKAGSFADLDAAIARCQLIVDHELEKMYKPDMTAEELFRDYNMFGREVWIEDNDYTIWEYAKVKCREICPDEW
ncbi:MAG TPA: hypothetical protein DD729_06365 [Rhodobacteraceae bacterium]|nr:hypothetical protein [Paracoccaceae bacterium]